MDSDSVKIPFIDFSRSTPLKQGSLEWESLRFQVRKAVEEYGCFEASFDEIPADSLSVVFKSVEELFDLPPEIKMKNTSEKPLHGYVGQNPSLPLYESMGFEGADVLDKLESLIKPLWSQGNPSFSKIIQAYAKQLSELDQMVRRMIVESYRLEKYIDEHLNSTTYYLLRMMKYKSARTSDSEQGIQSHTDKVMMTILCQNGVDGLEVQTKDGEWIQCQYYSRPNSFVVMVGDSLHAWLNGRVHPPVHRVMMSRGETRYSLGLFAVPRAGYIIKAPKEMVDKQHPLLFKPYDFAEFVKSYDLATAAGPKSANGLREYCGI